MNSEPSNARRLNICHIAILTMLPAVYLASGISSGAAATGFGPAHRPCGISILATIWAGQTPALGVVRNATRSDATSGNIADTGSFSSPFSLAAVMAPALLAVVLAVSWSLTTRRRARSTVQRLNSELTECARDLDEASERLHEHERLAVLGRLTATVSHELRNPLGTIRTGTFVIREHLKRAGLDAPSSALDRIDRSLNRCESIIQALLDYTRTPTLSMKATDFDTWVEHLLGETRLPESVTLHAQTCSGATVTMDRERMRRVISNLTENAYQAITGSRTGVLTGEETPRGCISVATHREETCVVLSVTDDGPGMPDDVRRQAFDALFTTKSYGIGLGLAVVRQIVELHGGTVAIARADAGSTTVEVTLPLAN